MKKERKDSTRNHIKAMLALFCVMFIVLSVYLGYIVNVYGNRWFASPYNTRVANRKGTIAAGMLLEQEPGQLWLLAGDKAPQNLRQVNARAMRRVLDVLGKKVDYIIVDTPPCGLLADSVNVARAADCVLYVLGAGAIQIPQVLDSMQFLNEAGTPLVGCVLNGVSSGSHGGYGYGYGSGEEEENA